MIFHNVGMPASPPGLPPSLVFFCLSTTLQSPSASGLRQASVRSRCWGT